MHSDLAAVDQALSYVSRGWPVIPLHSVSSGICSCRNGAGCTSKGKHPRTAHGLRDASMDEARIREWFGRYPTANVGILTGRQSGIFVLDVDAKSGGPGTLANLAAQHGELPSTLVQDTGGGGAHYVFGYPDHGVIKSRAKVAPGIDVRGDGGYIVVAPSIHESARRYAFRTDPRSTEVVFAPAWLVDLCSFRRPQTANAGPKRLPRLSDRDAERVRDALHHVDADDRDVWLRVGAALRHGLGEAGRSIWDEWSRRSSKFDERDQERTWASLNDHPDPASAATIFHLAEQGGWVSAKSSNRSASRSVAGSTIRGTDTFELTDAGNAERFVEEQRTRLRFNKGIGWLAWDGVRWTTGQRAESHAHGATNALVKTLHAEAADVVANPAAYTGLLRRARRAGLRAGFDAILALASRDARLLVHADQLDADPLLLNCPNGIVDLRTGRLLPHDPQHLMTHLAGVAYEPHAECPIWLKTLDEVFAGEDQAEVIDFVQRAVGYSLTGLTKEEVFFMLFGDGRNGKGTIVEQIRRILGSYAQVATMSLFLSQKHDSSKQFELARLKGARMVIASEVGADRSFDLGVLKQFTGGDRRTACEKHKPHFEYPPTDKLWMQVNEKPTVPSWDTAFQERCRLLPFQNQFTEELGNLDRNRKANWRPNWQAFLRGPSEAAPSTSEAALHLRRVFASRSRSIGPRTRGATSSLSNTSCRSTGPSCNRVAYTPSTVTGASRRECGPSPRIGSASTCSPLDTTLERPTPARSSLASEPSRACTCRRFAVQPVVHGDGRDGGDGTFPFSP